MNYPLVFDVETKYSFQEVGRDLKKLEVSVVGVFDYRDETFSVYREENLKEFFRRVEHTSFLIGFNINHFDLPVLSPYYLGNIKQFKTLDLLVEIEKNLGHRISLDNLARATLGTKKSGHGFMAINYFRQGDWEKLESYCLDDVRITKQLYEYAVKNGKLHYQTAGGIKETKINLKTNIKDEKITVSLSLPF